MYRYFREITLPVQNRYMKMLSMKLILKSIEVVYLCLFLDWSSYEYCSLKNKLSHPKIIFFY